MDQSARSGKGSVSYKDVVRSQKVRTSAVHLNNICVLCCDTARVQVSAVYARVEETAGYIFLSA
jgi:hypothetical protein